MLIENRNEYVHYRLKRANEAFEEAMILAENKRWNAVINRLYYSCFYAVIALLIKHDFNTQSHDGVKRLFGVHFIKTSKIEKKYGKLLSKLSDYRQKGDYGDLFDFDEEFVIPLIEKAKDFLSVICSEINLPDNSPEIENNSL